MIERYCPRAVQVTCPVCGSYLGGRVVNAYGDIECEDCGAVTNPDGS